MIVAGEDDAVALGHLATLETDRSAQFVALASASADQVVQFVDIGVAPREHQPTGARLGIDILEVRGDEIPLGVTEVGGPVDGAMLVVRLEGIGDATVGEVGRGIAHPVDPLAADRLDT